MVQSKRFEGSDFLHQDILPEYENSFNVSDNDCEVKTNLLSVDSQMKLDHCSHVSSWTRLKIAVVIMLAWRQFMKQRVRATRNIPATSVYGYITAVDLHQARIEVYVVFNVLR